MRWTGCGTAGLTEWSTFARFYRSKPTRSDIDEIESLVLCFGECSLCGVGDLNLLAWSNSVVCV